MELLLYKELLVDQSTVKHQNLLSWVQLQKLSRQVSRLSIFLLLYWSEVKWDFLVERE